MNPFPDKERSLKTWISDDAGDAASVDQALAAAPFFGLSQSAANAVLNDIQSAVKNWKTMARGIGMTAGDLEAYAPAFLGH